MHDQVFVAVFDVAPLIHVIATRPKYAVAQVKNCTTSGHDTNPDTRLFRQF